MNDKLKKIASLVADWCDQYEESELLKDSEESNCYIVRIKFTDEFDPIFGHATMKAANKMIDEIKAHPEYTGQEVDVVSVPMFNSIIIEQADE